MVAAGVSALHVHPRDGAANETLAGAHVEEVLAAIRELVSVPIGVSTGAWIVPDPLERLHAIERWKILPDFASVNVHEEGAVEVAGLLLERGIGVEAGVWSRQGAVALVDSDLGDRCVRVLLEPMEQTVEDALANVAAIENVIADVPAGVPRLLHGYERTAWPLLGEAARRGLQGRIGFEDTLQSPDGRPAESNAELARTAVRLVSSQ